MDDHYKKRSNKKATKQQVFAKANTGKNLPAVAAASAGHSQTALWARNATVSRPRRSSVPTLTATDKDETIADNLALNREAPDFWPCKPDLAACSQNMAAFIATAASKSSTNGKHPIPTAGMVYGYMRVLFLVLKLEPECCVYAYIYMKRLLAGKGNKLRIRPGNWKKILVGTCLLASKFVDDLSMKNCDFAKALSGWSRKRINLLEFNILAALCWKVYVPISEYTLRYFELIKPRVSSCDWGVDVRTITPFFRVRRQPLEKLFQHILEYHPGK